MFVGMPQEPPNLTGLHYGACYIRSKNAMMIRQRDGRDRYENLEMFRTDYGAEPNSFHANSSSTEGAP